MSPLPSNIPQCRHVKTNGIRCGSPALRARNFCYFHHHAHQRPGRPAGAAASAAFIPLPILEDANAVQLALHRIAQAIAEDGIDPKRAALLLYAFQTASANLKRVYLETPLWEKIERDLPGDSAPDEDGPQPALVGDIKAVAWVN
jgi:hypothetical protein